MMSTGPASDETSPERGRAEMPTAFTQPPFARATDMLAPPSHTSGRKAVWISSSFDPEQIRSRCAELIIAKLFEQPKSSKSLQIVATSSFSSG